MGKGSRKFMGFLWALIIAIVSFFVIFFFFPDVSLKFFGTAGRVNKEKVSQAMNEAQDELKDALDIPKTVGEQVGSFIDKTIDAASDTLNEIDSSIGK